MDCAYQISFVDTPCGLVCLELCTSDPSELLQTIFLGVWCETSTRVNYLVKDVLKMGVAVIMWVWLLTKILLHALLI